jgi:hypothetical protein
MAKMLRLWRKVQHVVNEDLRSITQLHLTRPDKLFLDARQLVVVVDVCLG